MSQMLLNSFWIDCCFLILYLCLCEDCLRSLKNSQTGLGFHSLILSLKHQRYHNAAEKLRIDEA